MNKSKNTKTTKAELMSSDEDVPTTKVVTKTKGKPVKKADSDEESDQALKNKTKRTENGTNGVKKVDPVKTANPKVQAKVTPKVQEPSDSDEESLPVKKQVGKAPVGKAPVKSAPKKVDSDSDEDSDEAPVKKPVGKAPVKTAPQKVDADSDEDSDEAPKKPLGKAAPKKVEIDSDEEEEVSKPLGKTFKKPDANQSGCTELFIRNLSWNTDEDSLENFFAKYGTIQSKKILTDRNTGKPRGLGFLEFSSREEAQAALDDAENLTIDGRLVQVSFSDQKPDRQNEGQRPQGNSYGGGQSSFGGGNRGGEDKHSVFVGNLGFKTTPEGVREFFAGCGNVLDVRVAKNEEGRSKGFAHIDFDSADAVEKAKALTGGDLDGREIRVDASTPRQGGGSRGGFGGGRGGGRGGFRGGRGGFRGGRGGY